MFKHTGYPESLSLSVLVTVPVAFAQISLVLSSVQFWKIWKEWPSELGDKSCSLA